MPPTSSRSWGSVFPQKPLSPNVSRGLVVAPEFPPFGQPRAGRNPNLRGALFDQGAQKGGKSARKGKSAQSNVVIWREFKKERGFVRSLRKTNVTWAILAFKSTRLVLRKPRGISELRLVTECSMSLVYFSENGLTGESSGKYEKNRVSAK